MALDLLDPIDLTLKPPYYVTKLKDARWWNVRECDFQWAFADWLAMHRRDLRVEREATIAPGNRPDFLAQTRVGDRVSWLIFELKRWGDRSAVRQLGRYVEALSTQVGDDVITGVLVAENFDLERIERPEWLSLQPVTGTVDWSGLE
jgi:hypothetical protein